MRPRYHHYFAWKLLIFISAGLIGMGFGPSVQAAYGPAEEAAMQQKVSLMKDQVEKMQDKIENIESMTKEILEMQKQMQKQMSEEHQQIRQWSYRYR